MPHENNDNNNTANIIHTSDFSKTENIANKGSFLTILPSLRNDYFDYCLITFRPVFSAVVVEGI